MNPSHARSPALQWATAASVALGLQVMRVLFPMLFAVREARGVAVAAGLAGAVFLSPFGAAAVRRLLGAELAVALSLGALAFAALAMQLMHPIELWLVVAATVAALVSLTLLLHTSRSPLAAGGALFAIAFLVGLVIDTGLHARFRTWDPMWHSGPLAVATTVALAGIVLAAMAGAAKAAQGPAHELRTGAVAPVAALGPFLLLQVWFLQNVALVSSAAGTSLAVATAAILVGQALSIVISIRTRSRWSRGASFVGGIALAVPVLAITSSASSWIVVGSVTVAVAAAGPLFSAAMATGGGPVHPGAWRTAVSVGAGTTLFIVGALAYQLDVVFPLPVPRWTIPIVAALLLTLAADRTTGTMASVSDPPMFRRPALTLPVVMLAVVALPLATTDGAAPGRGGDRPLRVASWNVHAGVDRDGQLDPERLARTLEARDPDVVILQEVPRGWPIAGTVDLATWLSYRLDMPSVWGPAADGQFGNLVLSRLPIRFATIHQLPYGSGPQHRSFIVVGVATGDTTVTVVGTHLEAGSPGTRALQIRAILAEIEGRNRTIVGGDLNMQPADHADVELFERAGLISVQDAAGDPRLSTARDPAFPGDRPDWIFVTGDLTASDFAIVDATASDHRPLIVSVSA